MPTVRRVARLVLLAALALLLGACLRVQQDLTLNPDDTIDGIVTVAVSEELIELSGQSAEDAFAQISQGEPPVPEGVEYTESDYQEDGYIGKTYTVTGAPLDAFAAQGDISISREGETFVVDGTIDLSSEATGIDPNDPTVQQMLDQFDMTIAVTFPGDVTEQNGNLDGTTVTWSPAFGQATEIHAVGSAVDGGSSMSWLLFIGLAVLLVIAIAIVIVMRGRGKPEGVDTGEPEGGEVGAVAATTSTGAVDQPAPPPPTGDVPPPTGDVPPPTGDVPPPTGDVPPPTGDVPPPTGDVPPPTGDVPPPTGDVPPPTGDVPPPTGDVPPPA